MPAAFLPMPWQSLNGFAPQASVSALGTEAGNRPKRSGDRNKLRVANFVALSGSPGIWAPSAMNSTLLAACEINARGGVLGREVEVLFLDASGTAKEIARRVKDVISFDEVDVIVGSHTSAVRVALREHIAGRIPYIYTTVYEGGERTPGVIAIGETPRNQSRPAIHWLGDVKKASRWYLIGSDYVWPWLSHQAMKQYIAESGGQVVGEEFVPVGEDDYESHLARIRAAAPDVVLVSLIGADSITFNRSFAEQGLASKMLRLASAFDETVLLGIGPDSTENLFCASGYFNCVRSSETEAFVSRYEAAFGRSAAPAGSVGQSNYEGLMFLEEAARCAGSLAPKPLLSAADHIVYRGGRGPITLSRGHADMPIYLSQADGIDFRVVRTF
ncbi:nitrile hydratase [Afipia sp. Root123D2]|uniref:substrate-binding domain-containing protein n=1 Tax=Afipia sp. Root123D2 TaxID=1736436 RepID=UPI0006F25256|nr:substrate-binding domain-containing protein [Afipia sp. Root123D2]KQW20984.1 nitrile hydratase [Afipia sp. Root123D2]